MLMKNNIYLHIHNVVTFGGKDKMYVLHQTVNQNNVDVSKNVE